MAKQITNKNTFYNSHTYNLSCFCHLYVRTMIDAGDLSVNKNFPPSQRMQINYERKKMRTMKCYKQYFYLILLIWWSGMHLLVCVWRSENNLCEFITSFHHVDSRFELLIELCGKCLSFQAIYLPSPTRACFKNERQGEVQRGDI